MDGLLDVAAAACAVIVVLLIVVGVCVGISDGAKKRKAKREAANGAVVRRLDCIEARLSAASKLLDHVHGTGINNCLAVAMDASKIACRVDTALKAHIDDMRGLAKRIAVDVVSNDSSARANQKALADWIKLMDQRLSSLGQRVGELERPNNLKIAFHRSAKPAKLDGAKSKAARRG